MSDKLNKREQQRSKQQVESLRLQVWNLNAQLRDWKRMCRRSDSQVKRIRGIANER